MGASPVHSQRRLIVAPAEPAAAVKFICIALSFNGRTSDSDSLDRGSNPWGATKHMLCSGIRHGVRIPGVGPKCVSSL